MASLSVEQIDKKIRSYEHEIGVLRSARATILKYAENGGGKKKAEPQPQRSPQLAPNATGLRAAILKLNLPAQFTVEMVFKALQAQGFNFAARNPKWAVRDCLYVMTKRKKGIRQVKQGSGGEPSLYGRDQV